MLSTILKISLINLRRDRVAFMMTFILPVVFFSVFALIFGATDQGARNNKIRVAVTDRDNSEVSNRFVQTLRNQKMLDVTSVPDEGVARNQVHEGKFPVAIVVLKGFADQFGDFVSNRESVELFYDASNPMAQNAVAGLIQAAAMISAPDILMEKGFASLEQFGGGMTSQQRQALDSIRPYVQGGAAGSNGDATQGMVKIRSTDVRAGEMPNAQRSMVAYYAAGIGVMFLLFSMSGAGGAFLDESESGTLERLLATNVSMTQILLGKWLFLTLVGITQISIMFLWARAAFHLELFTAARLSGFAAMAAVTAASAAAFGLVLASACRTRAQVSGVGTIVILIMSVLGGSMVPRFIMPKFMETTALFTINGWALDGFLKVFWYADSSATAAQSLFSLLPQLAVLTGLAAVFLLAARTLARRWESL